MSNDTMSNDTMSNDTMSNDTMSNDTKKPAAKKPAAKKPAVDTGMDQFIVKANELADSIATMGLDATASEGKHSEEMGGKYSKIASELGELFAINPDRCHLAMCKWQDSVATSTLIRNPSGAWNTSMSGIKKALKKLPTKLEITSSRSFDPAQRATKSYFRFETSIDVSNKKKELERENAEAAEKAETAELARLAAETALIDSLISESTLVETLLSECTRLGLSRVNALKILARQCGYTVAKIAKPAAKPA